MNSERRSSEEVELAITLRHVEDVRQQTRAAVHPVWFPMLLFGVLGLASIPFALAGGGHGTALFWLVAGPAGGIATSRHYRRRAMSLGAGMRGGAYVLIGTAIFFGAWIGGALTDSSTVPMLAIAAGYLGFAYLEKSWPVALVATALAGSTVVVALTDPSRGDLILMLVFGLAFTGTGLLLRRRDRG
jgi:hypothetical protein